MTKPSRPLSNGREAPSGSSLRVESAFIDEKPPTTASWIAASVPPASMMSASPRRMVSHDSPIAWAPVAQADTVAKFGPSIPNAIATWPEPTFAMPIGMKNGEIRSGPRSAMSRTLSNSVATPPSPEPRMQPVRSASAPSIRPGQPRLVQRLARDHEPELDVAVHPPHLLAVDDAARVEVAHLGGDLRVDARRIERLDRPDAGLCPASSPAHVDATSLPSADTAPMPVTTTRRTPLPFAPLIGPACPFGRSRRGRRRRGGRGRRSRSRRRASSYSARRISAVTVDAVLAAAVEGTSAQEAVASPSKA